MTNDGKPDPVQSSRPTGDWNATKNVGSCEQTAWPEDHPDLADIPCHDCALTRPHSRLIWGEGNPHANVWILLDNPGLREDRDGAPFVCGTRQTLHATADEFGYSEQSLYVTFVVRRRPTRKYPKDAERRLCIRNFYEQVSRYQPRLVYCMGDVATQALLGTEHHVRSMRSQRHVWNGRTLLVTYHPLAIRRRPNLLSYWRADWALLSAVSPP